MSQTIGEISKNPYEKIVATLGEFKGRTRIDLRMYFKPEVSEADKWVPTKKGINLDVDMWSDFKELVGKVDEALGKAEGG